MPNFFFSFKEFLLDIFYPKICLNCNKEGNYLCQDCQGILGILEYQYCLCEKPIRIPEDGKCSRCRGKRLDGLYFAIDYQNPLAQKLIKQFKYEPYIKELSKTLSSLIVSRLLLLEKPFDFFADFILVPVPLHKNKLKQRGFNQAEELGKGLAEFLKIPLVNDALAKTKKTVPQVELDAEARKENIAGAFLCQNRSKIQGKKILLIDDVYTTGSTMEECARALKGTGAKEVWGVTVARG